jgi:hypothetical protein
MRLPKECSTSRRRPDSLHTGLLRLIRASLQILLRGSSDGGEITNAGCEGSTEWSSADRQHPLSDLRLHLRAGVGEDGAVCTHQSLPLRLGLIRLESLLLLVVLQRGVIPERRGQLIR